MLPIEEQPELMQDIEKDNPTEEVEHVVILIKLLEDVQRVMERLELNAIQERDWDSAGKARAFRTRITWNLGQLTSGSDGRV